MKFKQIKKSVVNGTKIWLRKWYMNNSEDVIYYTVSSSDCSFRQSADLASAERFFDALVEFEKKQLLIDFKEK